MGWTKERQAAYMKEYLQERRKDPGFIRQEAEYRKTYNAANRERRSAYNKQYAIDHQETIKAKNKRYMERNQERVRLNNRLHRQSPKGKATRAAYRAVNREKMLAYSKEWYKANKSRMDELAKADRLKDPERYSTYRHTRRSRLANAIGAHTPAELCVLFDKQGGKCATCKVKIAKTGRSRYHLDHVMPLSKGGSNYINNIQLLCQPCNQKKYTKLPDTWAAENGLLFC